MIQSFTSNVKVQPTFKVDRTLTLNHSSFNMTKKDRQKLLTAGIIVN